MDYKTFLIEHDSDFGRGRFGLCLETETEQFSTTFARNYPVLWADYAIS